MSIILQVSNLKDLQTNGGFWDNFIWPLCLAIVIGLWYIFRKKIQSLFSKKEFITIININTDEFYNLTLSSDEKLFSKLMLIKNLVRNNQKEKFEIKIHKLYTTKQLNDFEKKQLDLHLETKTQEIKDKIEILLLNPLDTRIDNSGYTLNIIIENLLQRQDSNVTNYTKLDIYRTTDPKISFPVYLNPEQFQEFCNYNHKTELQMKNELKFQLHTTSAFNDNLLFTEVIPSFIKEIYRLKSRHSFDINTSNWCSLYSYEVGLG